MGEEFKNYGYGFDFILTDDIELNSKRFEVCMKTMIKDLGLSEFINIESAKFYESRGHIKLSLSTSRDLAPEQAKEISDYWDSTERDKDTRKIYEEVDLDYDFDGPFGGK